MRCLLGINDEELINVVQEYLSRIDEFSYVKIVSSPETAKHALLEQKFDFMVASCCGEPDENQKFLRWIREHSIDIEVIYATHYNDRTNIQQAFRGGVCDYLILPFTFERFNLAIQRVIRKILFMHSQNEFTQEEVDDYITLSSLTRMGTAPSVKGISDSTLAKIQSYLEKIDTPFTAGQIAGEIGLSRITVRRYLENMTVDGLLKTTQQYGKVGRPNKLYLKNNTQGEV